MNKGKKLSKDNFISGAFITSFGIILSKILGILYVIPFYSLVKEQGGALYGYAYTIYSLFLAISTAGIPLAISKIISEYQTLGYYSTKEKVFKLGKRLALIIGLVSFLILFLFAPLIAKLILGDLTGGNSLKQITFVIRIISTAIIVVPILSIYRGYLEGHKYMRPASISNVVEQIVRVAIIILGSLFSVKVFHFSLETTVGIAVFGATSGALVGYFYLVFIVKKNKKIFHTKSSYVNEKKITNKILIRKIIIYSLPFILIDFFKSLYGFVDMFTVVKTIGNMEGYSLVDAETIISSISTWGSKFGMIITSISTGLVVSLIPNLTTSLIKKDKDDISKKILQTICMLLTFTLPITVGISLLSKPIWMLFYGNSKFGSSVLSYHIYIYLFMSLFITIVTITQVLKDYKTLIISLCTGIIFKIMLNVTFMNSFYNMGLPPYYGSISATILGLFISIIVCLISLKNSYSINYETLLKEILNIIFATILMTFSIILLRFILPSYSLNRVFNIPIIVMYTSIGCLVYFVILHKTKTLDYVLGKNYLKKILLKIKR